MTGIKGLRGKSAILGSNTETAASEIVEPSYLPVGKSSI
jgi:hypothetical protein